MLTPENTVLIIIDIEGNLAHSMYEKDTLFENAKKIIKGSQVLGVPIIVTEQIPEKLGLTVPEINNLISDIQHISKASFSCCGSEGFMRELGTLNRKQILLAGIEAHVCVYLTAMDLLDIGGYEVQIVADAVSSRTVRNRDIALKKMKDSGASLTSTEMALFELLKTAKNEKAREIFKIVK
jgi:nicotinamidase-related amidase